MHAKAFTVSAILGVASATLINNGLQAREVANALQKRQLGAACTIGQDVLSLFDSEPTPPPALTTLDPCNIAAVTGILDSPDYISYESAVSSWEDAHSSELASVEASILSACTADPSVLSSLSESALAGGAGSCSTGSAAGSVPTSGDSSSTITDSGSSPSSSGSTLSGTKSTKSAASSASSSTSKTTSASGNAGAQQTFAAYAGAAIVGAMGIIAAL